MENGNEMSINEVSQYLKKLVQEINLLVERKELPFKNGTNDISFNRNDIQQWAENQLEKKAAALPEAISLEKVLNISRIKIFREPLNKRNVLENMIDCFSSVPGLENRKELQESVFHRERLMSTGIGLGVAVPHVRLQTVHSLSLAVGICKHEIADYESLDGRPVCIIVMVIAGKGQHQDYIRLLAYLSSVLKSNEKRKALIEAELNTTVFNLPTNRDY